MRFTVGLALVALGLGIWFGLSSTDSAAPARPVEGGTESEAPAAFAVPDATSDGGHLSGVVALENGTPLAGVVVSARGDDAAPERSATTDARGRYRIDGLLAERVQVSARREGYVLGVVPPWNEAAVPVGERVDFLAMQLRRCTVDVLLPGGARADRASLHWDPRPARSQDRWTPEQHAFDLSSGTFELHATAGEIGELRSVPVVVPNTEELDPVVLQLEARNGIRGRVTFGMGGRPAQLDVRIGAAVAFPAVTSTAIPLRDFGDRARLERGDDTFSLLDLEPGRYVVAASIDGRTVAAHAEVTVGTGLAECTVRIEERPARSRVVRVTDAAGRPVEGVGFACEYAGKRGGATAPCTVVDRGDGSAFVSPHPIDFETADGAWTLVVGTRALGHLRVPYDPDDPADLEVKFPEPCTIRVVVEGADRPKVPLFVHVQRADQADYQVPAQGSNLDASGVAKLSPVPSGEVEVLLGTGREGLLWPYARTRATVHAGVNTVTIRAPDELHDVSILSHRVQEPGKPGEDRLLVRPTGEAGAVCLWYFHVPKGGEFVMRQLPAGEYRLTGMLDGAAYDKTFRIPDTHELSLP